MKFPKKESKEIAKPLLKSWLHLTRPKMCLVRGDKGSLSSTPKGMKIMSSEFVNS